MKVAAKRVLQQTAEQRGIPWGETVRELEAAKPELEALRAQLEDSSVSYPPYYLQQFHAYDEGNLAWLPAFEVEAATSVTMWRAFKDDALTPDAATAKLRGSIVSALTDYQQRHGCRRVRDVIDVGCSVGMSTDPLAEAFPAAAITGLDLSPYFLAVAAYRSAQGRRKGAVEWRHGLAEDAPFADASMDLVSCQFMIHECTENAIRGLARSARRLLRPGGCLLLVDINPRSKVIQGLPPAIATLMKSTEPHSDEYYSADLEGMLQEAGFEALESSEVDPRHFALLARVPE